MGGDGAGVVKFGFAPSPTESLPLFARLSLLLAGLSVTANCGFAQLIVPVSQTRKVSAFAQVDFQSPDMSMEAATDFSPFQATVTASDSNLLGTNSMVTAEQYSTITGDRITATLDFTAEQIGQSAVAFGSSEMDLTFVVTDFLRYELSGSLDILDEGQARYHLRSTNDPFDHLLTTNFVNSDYQLAYSGYLKPGTYTLELRATETFTTSTFVHTATSSIDLEMLFFTPSAFDCAGTTNSSGQRAVMTYLRDLELNADLPVPSVTAFGLPANVPGIFFYGSAHPPTPFGDGVLCVAQPLIRFPVVSPTSSIGLAIAVVRIDELPFSSGPGALLPGSTWTFQYWFRDTAAMGAGWNTSSTLTLTFTP